MAQSQGGNFRHRWDGLSVKLADDLRQTKAVPRKRIAPGSRRTSWIRRQLIRLRRKMSRQSHATFLDAKRKSDLGLFHADMEPFVKRMQSLYRIEKAINKRSEERTSELQSLMRISYAVFCLKKKTYITPLPPTLSTIT